MKNLTLTLLFVLLAPCLAQSKDLFTATILEDEDASPLVQSDHDKAEYDARRGLGLITNDEFLSAVTKNTSVINHLVKTAPRRTAVKPSTVTKTSKGIFEAALDILSSFSIANKVKPRNQVLSLTMTNFQPLIDVQNGRLDKDEALAMYIEGMRRALTPYGNCQDQEKCKFEKTKTDRIHQMDLKLFCSSGLEHIKFSQSDLCNEIYNYFSQNIATLGSSSSSQFAVTSGVVYHEESLDKLVGLLKLAGGDGSAYTDIDLDKYNFTIPDNLLPNTVELSEYIDEAFSSRALADFESVFSEFLNVRLAKTTGYEDIYEKSFNYIESKLTIDDKIRILTQSYTPNAYPGSTLNLFSVSVSKLLTEHFLADLLPSANDVDQRLDDLYSINQSKVIYNGDWGKHQYYDQSLRETVAALSYLWDKKPDEFKSLFSRNPDLLGLFIDSNEISNASRIEPFDLLSNIAFNQIASSETPDKASLKNFIRDSLYLDLHGKRLHTSARQTMILSRSFDDEGELEILCYKPTKDKYDSNTDSLYFYFGDTPYGVFGELSFSISELFNRESGSKSVISCDGIEYDVKLMLSESTTLQKPKPLSFDDGQIDVLFPVSLVAEVDDQSVMFLEAILTASGYAIDKKYQVDGLLEWFELEAQQTDVFMTAGHSLNSFSMSLGTSTAKVLELTKQPNSSLGETLPTRMKLVLPMGDFGMTSVNSSQLADIYRARRDQGKDPLFAYVISCSSEKNIPLWSLIYRSSADDYQGDISELADFPYVIASKRGFNTTSPLDLIGHLFFPMDVVSELSKGKQPNEINEFLKAAEYDHPLSELDKRNINLGPVVNLALQQVANTESGIRADKMYFDPAYNLDEENLKTSMTFGGVKLEAVDNQSGNLIFSVELNK